jgi:AcrR family transcriptional regulator
VFVSSIVTPVTTNGRPDRAQAGHARAAKGRRRRALGVEAIVDVALRIIDEEGTEAVSMRRVAAEFDTGPASLYAHVTGKDELLRLVLDRIIEEIDVPEGDTWQDVVRSHAHQVRLIFQRHGDAARLSFAHIPSGTAMLEGTERLLATMIEGGVPDKVAAWSLDILATYVAADAFEGWLMQQRFDDGSGRDPEELGAAYVDEVHATFAAMPADRFPFLARTMSVMMTGSSDERFAFGVDMLIAGFAAQVPMTEGDER